MLDQEIIEIAKNIYNTEIKSLELRMNKLSENCKNYKNINKLDKIVTITAKKITKLKEQQSKTKLK